METLQSNAAERRLRGVRSARRRSLVVMALLLIALPVTFSGQRGASAQQRSLDQLTDESALVVHGRVVSALVEPHPALTNLKTVVVRMRVLDTYKGAARRTVVFRQYLWDPDPRGYVAAYGRGAELVLFLLPVSPYGLTSPAGLEQGRFEVRHDGKGQAIAVNGRGNFGLFNSVQARAESRGIHLSPKLLTLAKQPSSGPVALQDLGDAIRSLAEAAK